VKIRLPRLVVISLLAASLAPANASAEKRHADWPAYLYGSDHGSYNEAAIAITARNVPKLGRAWTWWPDPAVNPDGSPTYLTSSPVVVNGIVYIGASNGWFTAIDARTGTSVWSRFFGYVPQLTCPARGFSATAAVAPDPVTAAPTVYVAAPDGDLHALDAETGRSRWHSRILPLGESRNKGYPWGSPTLAGGHVLVGIASNCDNPLVRGGLRMYDRATGRLEDTYWTVPKGVIGGSVWTTAAVEADQVWITTGDALDDVDPQPVLDPGDAYSVVRLRIRNTSLERREAWAVNVGTDFDFGGSPTLFHATVDGRQVDLVGACNKDGYFYALRGAAVSDGPIWSFEAGAVAGPDQSGLACFASAIWRPPTGQLIVAGRKTEIEGARFRGSVRSLDPATGDVEWQTGLQGGVLGTPTMNGNGLIAAATYSIGPQATNFVYVLDSISGAILWSRVTESVTFAQPVFADGFLFVAPAYGGLTAYCPGCSASRAAAAGP
jgi:outer membrane protein assembly factor BamB